LLLFSSIFSKKIKEKKTNETYLSVTLPHFSLIFLKKNESDELAILKESKNLQHTL